MPAREHLQLVHSAPAPKRGRAQLAGAITLPRTVELDLFLQASAARGLNADDAIRLAIERALILNDADVLGIDRNATRHLLCATATRARVRRALSPDQATYVRTLSTQRPQHSKDAGEALTVTLPDGVLSRARTVVPASALDSDALGEMVHWERAATLDGRTMGEWALLALATHSRIPAA